MPKCKSAPTRSFRGMNIPKNKGKYSFLSDLISFLLSGSFIAFVIYLLVVGYGKIPKDFSTETQHEEIKNIVKVVYHNSTKYTFFVKKDDFIEAKEMYFNTASTDAIKLIEDVPNEEYMYVEFDTYPNRRFHGSIKIHVHSISNIQLGENYCGKNCVEQLSNVSD